MSLQVSGKITKINDLEQGKTKEGKDWQKQTFLVTTTEQYNNLYCFEVFGKEKVDNFLKYNKVGHSVTVEFNVNTNEWKGRYFTSLSAWQIKKDDVAKVDVPEPSFERTADINDVDDDLPF